MDSQPGPVVRGKKGAIEAAYAEAREDSGAVMWFADEASFHCNPTLAPVWAAAGRRQPRVPLRVGADHIWRLAAGLDPVRGRLSYRGRPSFGADAIGQFYAQLLLAAVPATRIYLVLDNWPVHSHPTALRAIAADPRAKLLWLPTYAPWLNPAEKVWKWVRQHYSHMHPDAAAPDTFQLHLENTLAAAASDPAELLRYTGTGNSKLYS